MPRSDLSAAMLFLSEPSMLYKDTYLDALREFHQEARDLELDLYDLTNHFRYYLQSWYDRRANPKPGQVAESTFWMIEEETFIGRISVRHHLTESLMQFGGHIGYEIRPTKRRQGYGTSMLGLGLEKARAVNITRALVTCDDTNSASAKIIQANGGVLENIILLAGYPVPIRRYWIDVS
ncbi:MAG: GNAT family N-acetyltransferase [Chloroflexota bacterium]